MSSYEEREITAPVMLCDAAGRLNPEAVGWSRKPLHTCNLKGRWPRKKKWNYWCVTTDTHIFSVTLADIDYIGLAAVYLIDAEAKKKYDKTLVLPFGGGCVMPEKVEESVSFNGKAMKFSLTHSEGKIGLHFECENVRGAKMEAEIDIEKPEGHETLNVVIPWSGNVFQFTSKQNCLPAHGVVVYGEKTYRFESGNSYACLDYGRGIWPYSITWNWASGSGRQGEDTIGIQLGDKWTDGAGMNENGISLNGRLYKISEDVRIECDTSDYTKPWTLKSSVTDRVNLTLSPIFDSANEFSLVVLGTWGHQVFGRFSGTLTFGDRTVEIENISGWAELVKQKW